VIGAGSIDPFVGPVGGPFEDWLITDFGSLNALDSREWEILFPPQSIDRILAEHVIEHWTPEQFRVFLKIVSRFLTITGRIRIAVPDGFHPDAGYLEAVKPGGTGPGSEDHKVLYNASSLGSLLTESGWNHALLEYFDRSGEFHYLPWDQKDGFVSRSSRNDPRNRAGDLQYTSLIVDIYSDRERGSGDSGESRLN
jgi:predicted SAM-dependent methyltransferase